MVSLEKDYEGYKNWKPGARQEVILEAGETRHDAILFMRAHLKFFGLDELTFFEGEVTTIDHRSYFFMLRDKKQAQPTLSKHMD